MSRHKAEVLCACGRKINVTLTLDGLTREGEKEKTRPIGPPIPEELVAVLAGTRNFGALGAKEYGAYWATIGALTEPFPNLFVDVELRKADAHLEANPRKKSRDYRRFLSAWMTRAIEFQARAEAGRK